MSRNDHEIFSHGGGSSRMDYERTSQRNKQEECPNIEQRQEMSINDRDAVFMEEGVLEWIMRDQAKETSRGNDPITEQGQEIRNLFPQKAVRSGLSCITEKLKHLDDLINEKAGDHEPATKPMIQKVPTRLREKENLKKYFEPRVVSIGPYHHENQNLKVTEEMKLKLAAMFIKEHLAEDKDDLYYKIKRKIEDLRECYEPEATQSYDDDNLAWIFLIDGCIVLHCTYVISKSQEVKGFEILGAVTDLLTFLVDLFLLENQLPYQVLELVMSSSKDGEELKKSIQQFIVDTTHIQVKENHKPSLENPAHLLDLMRTTYLLQPVENQNKCGFMVQIIEKSIEAIGKLPDTLMRLIHTILGRILQTKKNVYAIPFHNIEKLIEAGIKLKPNNTGCLMDISFSHGTLKIPHILLNEITLFKFLNLVAYEMCSNFRIDPEVSSYIFFLTSLITRAEDVKELRVNRVIYNNFDSNEEALRLFKVLRTADLFDSFGLHHVNILHQLQNHCDKKHNAWKAQLRRTYFRSPWSLIALIGAILALGLTIVQTVYSVFAYYKG